MKSCLELAYFDKNVNKNIDLNKRVEKKNRNSLIDDLKSKI